MYDQMLLLATYDDRIDMSWDAHYVCKWVPHPSSRLNIYESEIVFILPDQSLAIIQYS